MKKLPILICCSILFAVYISGCAKQKPEVELTKENFSKLHPVDLIKVYIYCPSIKEGSNRDQIISYSYEFPIEPKKGSVILKCIEEANQISYDRTKGALNWIGRKKGNKGIFIFETKNTKFSMPIFWDNESVYGFWWDSPELLSIFRGWGLFEDLAKADPNWPLIKNPPRETDPNDYYRSRNATRGRDINEASQK